MVFTGGVDGKLVQFQLTSIQVQVEEQGFPETKLTGCFFLLFFSGSLGIFCYAN